MNQKRGEFLGMLLGTLGASLLGNMLGGKGIIATSHGCGMMRAGYANQQREGMVRAG